MSDRMTPIPFSDLMNWILEERERHGSVFGLRKVFRAKSKSLCMFGENMETPLGPAAGPNSQLAQNIIASYIEGGRFFELKTVQVIDGEDLPVAKPCITAQDECYNVEWSTELRVSQAMDEYIKAWVALKVLSREFDLGEPDGFIFNMSVGYDLEGIKSDKVDFFIEGLKDASNTDIWRECMDYLSNNSDRFGRIDEDFIISISPNISRCITLSTLHGCPSDEIERIACYLLKEKKLSTFIKCNPTLLGYNFVRSTMDKMGYDYVCFDNHHFLEDLQYDDAVVMLRRLMALADDTGLGFGVKITNTLPVDIKKGELPGDEMYMSGRSLFPISTSLAAKLSQTFQGRLRISFSGGADAFNIGRIFDTGVWPITVATTILKPGGAGRLIQLADILAERSYANWNGIDTEALCALADDCITDIHHIKSTKPSPSRKLDKKVPLLDCFVAPCSHGCPIHQDIPGYVRLVGEGKYLDALKLITYKNPLPFITGTICNHRCTSKCTRNFYDESIRIREVKLEAAKEAFGKLLSVLEPPVRGDTKVAVVGGGPAGIAVSNFLARKGFDVTIFEKEKKLGGVVRNIIPDFRISDDAIDHDIEFIEKLGVKIIQGEKKSSAQELLKQGFSYVVFATGAYKPYSLDIPGCKPLDVLEFLGEFKSDPQSLNLGENVAIIGGGNTAMDAARAAKRVPGVKNVLLVYRRNRRFMPADEEELDLALGDGVVFKELVAPEQYRDSKLICRKMKLGEADSSGRRSPVATDETEAYPVDTVISSIGQRPDSEFFKGNGLDLNDSGKVAVDDKYRTNLENVFVIGDALGGPSTVVEAIADASAVADIITSRDGAKNALPMDEFEAAASKKGILKMPSEPCRELERCLECDTVCENCVDVCPNRANISIRVSGHAMPQILHVDSICNECGNCTQFCPYDSAPYREKFTLFASKEDFLGSENDGFVVLEPASRKCVVRLSGRIVEKKDELPAGIIDLITCVLNEYKYVCAGKSFAGV